MWDWTNPWGWHWLYRPFSKQTIPDWGKIRSSHKCKLLNFTKKIEVPLSMRSCACSETSKYKTFFKTFFFFKIKIYFQNCLHMIGTPFLTLNAYKARVGGVSPRCGIEQISEGGIGSIANSQSRQYLIGERFVHPTNASY